MHIKVLCKLESALLTKKTVKNSLKIVGNRYETHQGNKTVTGPIAQPKEGKGNRENMHQDANPTSTRGNICHSVVRPAVPAWPLGHFIMEKWSWEQPPHL